MIFEPTCFQKFESAVKEVVLTAKLNDGSEVSIIIDPRTIYTVDECGEALVKLKEQVVYGHPLN